MVFVTLLVIALLTAGLTLLLIEVFTPGFAVIGLTGIALTALAASLAYLQLDGFHQVLAASNGLVATGAIVWRFRRSGLAQKLVLLEAPRGRAPDPRLTRLVGRTGQAVTALRPAGKAEIDGAVVDVVAASGFVEPSASVQVVKVEGMRVVVELVRTTQEGAQRE